jgi:hypothetical protein
MHPTRAIILVMLAGLLGSCGEGTTLDTVADTTLPGESTTITSIASATSAPAPPNAPPTLKTSPTPEPPQTSPTPGPPQTSPTPGPPQTPATGPLTTPPTAQAVDPYLPAGLPDQVFPPGTAAYELLAAGECGPLLRQITSGEAPTTSSWSAGGVPDPITDLYTAAAEACLASWASAQEAFDRISTSALCIDPETGDLYADGSTSSFPSVTECQEQRLGEYQWTEDLLEASEANAAFVPNFPTPPKG